jgi:hypothetical protein
MRRLLGFASILLALGCSADRRPLAVTFYPTYGYLDEAGEEWIIPLRVWVHSPHVKTQALTEAAVAGLGITMAGRERELFGGRITDIVADSRSDQDVRFAFDADPERQVFRIETDRDTFPLSDLNGLVQGTVRLPRARAEAILRAQRSASWLTLREASPGQGATGRVVLIPREGRSVVSDIDDTIKVTEIPAGGKIVFRNTFLREFVAAPGMVDRYQAYVASGHVFHFVSGGPWQLHGPLATFLGEAGYPEGTFHMKGVTKNLLALSTWEGFYTLAEGNATREQKVAQISELLTRFPQRRFTLIGDSGEQDPEAYRTIRDRFGDQVEAIYIRHVLPGEPDARLAGMEIIDADRVVAGVSRLGN